MARKTPTIEATLFIDDTTWTVSGTYYAGSKDYFCKSFGNYLPGDPPEVEDITIVNDETGAEINFDSLDRETQRLVEDAIADAASDYARDREADEGDRAYDEWRDREAGY